MPSAVRDLRESGDTILKSPNRRSSVKILSRNIKQVLLGQYEFETWYYSPYPDSILHGPDYHGKQLANGDSKHMRPHSPTLGIAEEPACSCLYVCPYCFRYSPQKEDYVNHIQRYEHDRLNGQNFQVVPSTAVKVYEWEGFTVWDVDGEREKLYCQNLSLFGKLFLEQKSVFFDTAGFHYYVLTYTPAANGSPAARNRGRRRGSSNREDGIILPTLTMGFFSKENLSWDSNNLACILIFPPFQRRQLGQLLMAVSYKLSGWEWEGGVIGGPEKPLSTMGRKSYLRFWSERIARFIIGQTADADGRKIFENSKKRKAGHKREEITIKELGQRTGMLPEDVIAALNEMRICQTKTQKRKKTSLSDVNGERSASGIEEHHPADMTVPRSKILQWAADHHVDIVGPVKEEGFLGEWALSESSKENSEEMESEAEIAESGTDD